ARRRRPRARPPPPQRRPLLGPRGDSDARPVLAPLDELHLAGGAAALVVDLGVVLFLLALRHAVAGGVADLVLVLVVRVIEVAGPVPLDDRGGPGLLLARVDDPIDHGEAAGQGRGAGH